MRNRLILAFTVFVMLLTASPAAARYIVIDRPEFLPSLSSTTACTIGGGLCSGVSTNLIAPQLGQAYIYDRGIVSFGSPLPDTVNASTDLTTLGMPVIAPLYLPGPSGDAGPYTETAYGNVSPGSLTFNLGFTPSGNDLFIVTWLDPAEDVDPGAQPIIALIIDATASEVQFQMVHGMANNASNPPDTAFPDTTNRLLGFSINGQSLIEATPDITADNVYSARLTAVTSVPEPATWLSMLLGFGVLGLAVRRTSKRQAATS